MNEAHPLSTLIIIKSIDVNKGHFRSQKNNKNFLAFNYHILILLNH